MAHAAQFLKLVSEAKKKIKETNVADVKRRSDAGEKFLLVDVREDNEWVRGIFPAPFTGAGASSSATSSSESRTRMQSSSCIAAVDFAPHSWRRICRRWATTTSHRWMVGGRAGWKRACRSPKTSDVRPNSRSKKIGWGGRIRTFTVLINSEVSYQLDHAPAGCLRPRLVQGRTVFR